MSPKHAMNPQYLLAIGAFGVVISALATLSALAYVVTAVVTG